MRNVVRRACVLGLGCAVAASLTVTAQAAPAGSASAWRVVFRAKLAQSNVITGLAAAARDDAWAIGQIGDFGTGRLGYAVHWDGRSWQVVGLPQWFQPDNVFASAPGNVWIDGNQYQPGTNAGTVAALRWQGTGWQRMPPPPNGRVVLAVGAASAWAVGGGQWIQGQGWQFHSYFWDGSTWADRPLPALGPYPALAASPGGGVWAFGTSSTALSPKNGPLSVFRWAGTGWRASPVPQPITYGGEVTAAAQSAAGIWLVTVSTSANRDGTRHFVFWRWNGTTLTRLRSPAGGWPVPVGPPPVADGHGGAWFGPFAHWTGSWQFPRHCLGTGLSLAVSPVPGMRSAWGALDCQTNARPVEGVIDVTGPLP